MFCTSQQRDVAQVQRQGGNNKQKHKTNNHTRKNNVKTSEETINTKQTTTLVNNVKTSERLYIRVNDEILSLLEEKKCHVYTSQKHDYGFGKQGGHDKTTQQHNKATDTTAEVLHIV